MFCYADMGRPKVLSPFFSSMPSTVFTANPFGPTSLKHIFSHIELIVKDITSQPFRKSTLQVSLQILETTYRATKENINPLNIYMLVINRRIFLKMKLCNKPVLAVITQSLCTCQSKALPVASFHKAGKRTHLLSMEYFCSSDTCMQ